MKAGGDHGLSENISVRGAVCCLRVAVALSKSPTLVVGMQGDLTAIMEPGYPHKASGFGVLANADEGIGVYGSSEFSLGCGVGG